MANFYCTVRGTIATGSLGEIFQHSIAVSSPTTQADVANAIASTFLAAFGTSGTKLQGCVSSQVTYTEATAALINDLSGATKPVLQAATHSVFAPVLTGTASGNMLPAQSSMAISTTGGVKPNGANFKGRFYLPPMGASQVGTNGLVTPAVKTALTAWAAEWLGGLKFVGAIPCIWSRHHAILSPIASIRVGDRVDTMRSRRNKGSEVYSSATVT
jgi:hypothetical protein